MAQLLALALDKAMPRFQPVIEPRKISCPLLASAAIEGE
jgi:hypothetical protein